MPKRRERTDTEPKRRKRGQGEGSIYQRPDGRWVASIGLGWQDGKRKRKYLYGTTRAEVARKLTAELTRLHQGLPVVTERQTVAQFLDRWLEDVIRPNRSPKTHLVYATVVRLHLTPTLGRHQLTKLAPQHVQALVREKLVAGFSPATVAQIRTVLRIALATAHKWGLVSRNVAALVDPPSKRKYEARAMTPEEARRFLAAARGDRLEGLYRVAIALGLRKGEALGLQWADVDLGPGPSASATRCSASRGRGSC